jgi:hypothetical protein
MRQWNFTGKGLQAGPVASSIARRAWHQSLEEHPSLPLIEKRWQEARTN